MKKLFLSSEFANVFKLLSDFSEEELKGKRVSFIPTASIPEKIKFYVNSGKKALEKLGLVIDELEISKLSSKEISDKLDNNDCIYISGGNTFFLLQELKKKGANEKIIEQINLGKLYIGESAGSMILSPSIEYVRDMDDIEKATKLKDYSALSIIDFFPLPHHTNFPFKKTVEKIIEQYQSEIKLVPISNSQVIMVKGSEFKIESK